MAIVSLMKELWIALNFVSSIQFWRMGLLWTFSILYSRLELLKASLFNQELKSFPRCIPLIIPKRPICVVTGATSGLGLAAAHALSKEGYAVVIVGRSQQLLSEAEGKIKVWNRDAQVKGFQVDMSSVESIIKFKNSLRQWLVDSDFHCSVQLLINCAGILATSPRATAEGYDQMIATNYIGPFALTKLLLPLLESSPVSSRIVNVTSFTHRSVTDLQVDERTVSGKRFLSSKQYPYAYIYEYSKLCLLLFTFELQRQLRLMNKSNQIFVIAADPGVVQTNIMREVPSIISWVAYFVLKRLGLLQSPKCGMNSIIDAALAPATPETSGAYFFGGEGRTVEPSAVSKNSKLALQLWKTTCNLLSETPFGVEDN